MNVMVSLLLAFIFIVAVGVDAAGMNGHTYVGYRSVRYFSAIESSMSKNASYYNALLLEHYDAVAGGSDFPDFLYACGNYEDHHDAGEFAHWPPFQAVAISYIQDKLADPHYSHKELDKLIAFVFGVSIHYLADEFYEGLNDQLKNGLGFVRMLSSFNLGHDGKSDSDEGVANIGTDFWISFALDESNIKPWKRYFPVKALTEIYHRANFTNVTMQSLYNCKLVFDLGLWAEKTFGKVLFLLYSEVIQRTPFIAEHALDLPIGGLDFMAIYSGFVFQRVARWLDNGPPANPPPNRRRRRRRRLGDYWDDLTTYNYFKRMRKFIPYVDDLKKLANAKHPLISFRGDSPLDGLFFHGEASKLPLVKQVIETMLLAILDDEYHDIVREFDIVLVPKDVLFSTINVENPWLFTPKQAFHRGTSSLEYFGTAMAEGDFDGSGGHSQIAIGAHGSTPKLGRPQVGYVAVYPQAERLEGTAVHGQFGKALAVLDLNLDGIDDLVVGTPGWQADATKVADDTFPKISMRGAIYVYFGKKGRGLSRNDMITLSSSHDLKALGSVLYVGDVNNDGHKDLIIGAPFFSTRSRILSGGAYVILASSKTKFHTGGDIQDYVSWELIGEEYSWFGYSFAVHKGLLYVGAPGYRKGNKTLGVVHVYDTKTRRLLANLTGTEEEIGEFGKAIVVLDKFIVVGSPATGGALRNGSIQVFSLDLSFVCEVTGRASFGRFGTTIVASHDQQNLYVGSPLAHSERGSVVRVSGWCRREVLTEVFKGEERSARAGSALLLSKNGTLMISSPRHRGDGLEMNGRVFFLGH